MNTISILPGQPEQEHIQPSMVYVKAATLMEEAAAKSQVLSLWISAQF